MIPESRIKKEEYGVRPLDIKVLKKSDVNIRKLAELTYVARERSELLAEDTTEDAILRNISERIANHCHDLALVAEDNGKIVGWLAFYEISDCRPAHIWNWHPVVFPDKSENKIANGLIQEALSLLKEMGSLKVTIDFPRVNANTQSYFSKYLDWYSQCGVAEIFEEKFYKKNITEENIEISIPDEYSLGHIFETDLDDLFECWVEIFSSSNDQFFLSLDTESRRNLFFDGWDREKPLIKEASLTLLHKSKLIGFSRLLPMYEKTDGFLSGIGILPEYRRKGLAQELLKVSMLKLKGLDYQTMSFFVSTRNLAAISFYEKLGFKSKYRIASLLGEIT
ncbi:MAG: GNAT family N-acetyltransferase [Candidatus Bathyarchaeota archaeon]|nr:MAG: GNAT family N-acetyltransferase [Candidatus Bathyarchaeota archaeon]